MNNKWCPSHWIAVILFQNNHHSDFRLLSQFTSMEGMEKKWKAFFVKLPKRYICQVDMMFLAYIVFLSKCMKFISVLTSIMFNRTMHSYCEWCHSICACCSIIKNKYNEQTQKATSCGYNAFYNYKKWWANITNPEHTLTK